MATTASLKRIEQSLDAKFSILPGVVARRCRWTVGLYKKSLPDREFLALAAWLTTFYPFQLAWLLERSRHAIKNKARQTGMSHTSSAAAILWGVFHGELTTIISKNDDSSKETFLKAKKHQLLLEKLGSKLAVTTRNIGADLEFVSGGRIKCRPSTGAQGDTGNVIIDEFAYHEHQKATWDRAVAATTHGGLRTRVLSTPNGAGDMFHDLWKKAVLIEGATEEDYSEHRWILHETSIHKAIDQGMPIDLKACWAKANGDPRVFGQMYECSFLDGSLQYIPGEAVKAAAVAKIKFSSKDSFFAGLDIGRNNDRTVLVVCSFDGVLAKVQAFRSCKRTDSAKLQSVVDWAFSTFPIRRLCVDQTGLGAFPVDDMRRRHGRQRVEGVTFTEGSKEDLATILYDAFCGSSGELRITDGDIEEPRGWVQIPATDDVLGVHFCDPGGAKDLRDDVCAIRRIVTSAGNVRYDAPRTDEGHADSAWALALALHAINHRPATVWQQ
jgi:phage FluMu gp28-like protein